MAISPIRVPGGNKTAALALAAALAAPAEGIRQYAYYDPPGILTVCRGHTGSDVVKDRRYSLTECNALFDDDMKKHIAIVDRCVPGLPVEVLAAFSDAAFNIGPTIACNTAKSTAARKLQSRDFVGACNELPRWDKASVAGVMVSLPGLTKRRQEEQALCLKGAMATTQITGGI